MLQKEYNLYQLIWHIKITTPTINKISIKIMKNISKMTLIIISTITIALLYIIFNPIIQTINKVITKIVKTTKITITKHTINTIIKVIYYMFGKISKQIVSLPLIAMVIDNNPTRKHITETTNPDGNKKNKNPMKGKNSDNQIFLAAWNIKCNNKKLPELEKKVIKKWWDIVFISKTSLISSKIGSPTTENQIFLQDYVIVWSSPTKSRLIKRWKGKKIEEINNKYKKQREEERKKKPIPKERIKKLKEKKESQQNFPEKVTGCNS